MKKTAITLAALALTATAAMPAAAAGHKPDVACMQAGLAVLKDGGLLPGVAKGGLAWETALSPAIGGFLAEAFGYPAAFVILGSFALASIAAWVGFHAVLRPACADARESEARAAAVAS